MRGGLAPWARTAAVGLLAVGLVAAFVVGLDFHAAPFDPGDVQVTRYVDGNNLTDVAVGDDGTVWVGTHRAGIGEFDGQTWRDHTVSDGLTDQAVTSVAAGDGQVWAATPSGVARFDGDRWRRYTAENGLPDAQVELVTVGAEGSVWAATGQGFGVEDDPGASRVGDAVEPAVSRFADGRWQTFTTDDGLPHDVEAITVDHHGALWVSDRSEPAVTRFDGHDWQSYTRDDGLPPQAGAALQVSADGAVWTSGDGSLARFDGDEWHTEAPEAWEGDGPMETVVQAVAAGDDADVWATTRRRAVAPLTAEPHHNTGLWRFDGREWQEAQPLPGGGVGVLAVAADGTLWAATGQGLAESDGQAWSTHPRRAGPAGDHVTSISVAHDGTVWTTGPGGLARFDGAQWRPLARDENDPLARASAVAAADDGSVWVYGQGGVLRVHGDSWTRHSHVRLRHGRAGDAITADSDGAVWLASGERVLRFDGDSWSAYGSDHGLAAPEVTSLAVAEDGTAWAGLAPQEQPAARPPGAAELVPGGVARLRRGEWRHFTTADGLAADAVRRVAVDHEGNVWAATAEGLSVFDGRRWRTHTSRDGVPNDDIAAVTVGPDGTVWAGTLGGVAAHDGGEWTTYPLRVPSADGGRPVDVTELDVGGDGAVWVATAGSGVLRLSSD